MANLYDYYVGVYDLEEKTYITDRGVVIADSIPQAVEQVLKESESRSEEVVSIEINKAADNEIPSVISFYGMFSESNIGKEQLERELKDWYLI